MKTKNNKQKVDRESETEIAYLLLDMMKQKGVKFNAFKRILGKAYRFVKNKEKKD